MIRGSSSTVLRWDVVIIVLSIYNSLAITLQIAFEPPELNDYSIQIIDALIDFVFLVDIVFTFRTTQLDIKTG